MGIEKPSWDLLNKVCMYFNLELRDSVCVNEKA